MCLSRSCCKCDIASSTNTTNTPTTNTCTSSIADSDNCHLSYPAVSDICSNATCHKTQNATKSAQNARFCNLYKSRKTKSYVCLLIVLSAILVETAFATPVQLSGQKLILHTSEYRQRYHQQLLQKERSTVQPTTKYHHHLHLRSAPNMQETSFSCKSIAEEVMKEANESQSNTKLLMREYFKAYMQKQYPHNKIDEWKLHELNLAHPYQDVLERDFDKVPDKSHFPNLSNTNMSRELLERELYNIYKTLVILQKAFAEVIKNRKDNHVKLSFDYGNDPTKEITKFFEDCVHYVKVDIGEVIRLMNATQIPIPQANEIISTFSKTDAHELLLAREYLSVGQHVCEIYKILLSKCSS